MSDGRKKVSVLEGEVTVSKVLAIQIDPNHPELQQRCEVILRRNRQDAFVIMNYVPGGAGELLIFHGKYLSRPANEFHDSGKSYRVLLSPEKVQAMCDVDDDIQAWETHVREIIAVEFGDGIVWR